MVRAGVLREVATSADSSRAGDRAHRTLILRWRLPGIFTLALGLGWLPWSGRVHHLGRLCLLGWIFVLQRFCRLRLLRLIAFSPGVPAVSDDRHEHEAKEHPPEVDLRADLGAVIKQPVPRAPPAL